MTINFNLALPFYRNSLRYPESMAISADGKSFSYAEIANIACRISGWLHKVKPKKKIERVGILASRSMEACAAVLGTCWAGGTYVPIGLKLPEERLQQVIRLSELDAVITDSKGAQLLSPKVLASCPMHILTPDQMETLAETTGEPVQVNAEDVGYIEFTSGTTGIPKGVMISAGSVHQYISVMQDRYQLTPQDRIAETADLSFDISVSNMFCTWQAGASLHVVPATQAMAPAKFIQEHAITFWYSVPSIITFMQAVKALLPGAFPTLRHSIFAGDVLPVNAALLWQQAAPDSTIDNFYGPTEATVICMSQRLNDPPAVTPQRDIIAIGKPFPGTETAIVNSHLRFLPQGEQGEIALAGKQLALGYFNAPELTEDRFRIIDGKRWYLTGDLGFQDAAGTFHHLGRLDNQVKVLGNRVELEEIEAHLRDICGSDSVAAVAWPVANGTASGIVGFVADVQMKTVDIKNTIKNRVPSYMVPSAIYSIASIPMTANGKINRNALLETLDKGGYDK